MDSATSLLTIRLFGSMDVRRAGQPLPPLRSRTGQSLLALLILHHGREVEREWLAAVLWPESSAQQAAYNLRRNLTDLRRVLGPDADRLHSPSFHTLRLDLDGVPVDLIAFDAAIARWARRSRAAFRESSRRAHDSQPSFESDVDSLEEAVALYRGPLLEGCAEEWLLGEREPREQAYLQALEELAAEKMARDDLPAAERYLRRAVACDPLRETAQRALMRALADQGQYAAVVLVYRDLCDTLHGELNAAPDAETRALFQSLRGALRAARSTKHEARSGQQQDLRPPPALRASCSALRASSLPRAISSFVGRESEVAEVIERLATTRLLTLTGAGGVGKTRLALEVGEALADQCENGAWFVDLAALVDPALVAATVARTLGVAEPTGRPAVETLREFLLERELLLILDNCEHLVAACAELAATLLGGCPRLRVLATSRQSLGVTGEIVWAVPSLSLPPEEAVADPAAPPPVPGARCPVPGRDEAGPPAPNPQGTGHRAQRTAPEAPGLSLAERLLQYEAVHLFAERGAAVSRGFALTDQNAAAVAQLCRRLDGLPLAIELAAARLRALTVEQLASRLDDRHRHPPLRGGGGGAWPAPAASTSVGVVGGHPAAERPAPGAGPRAVAPLGRVPDLLVGGSRAVLPRHQTLRAALDWSHDLLTEPERVLLRRLSIFVGGFTLEAAEAICAGEEGVPSAECRVPRSDEAGGPAAFPPGTRHRPPLRGGAPLGTHEVLDLLASLVDKSLVQQDVGGRFRLLETIREYALERLHEAGEHSATAERHVAWAVALAEAAETGLHGPDQLAWLGHLADEMDNFRAAMEGSLNRQGGETAGRLAGALARFFHWRGYVTEGRGWLERVLSAGTALSLATRARLLLGAALLCHEQAEAETARRYAEESLALQRQLDNPRGVAEALEELGHIVNLQGEFEQATALFEECLTLSRSVGDRARMASALNDLGYMAWFYQESGRAAALCEESLRLHREMGHLWGIAYSLEFLGLARVALHDLAEATRVFEECLRIRRELEDRRGVAAALMQLGFAAQIGGDAVTGRRYFEESLPLWWEVNNPDNAGTVLNGLANVHRMLGEYARSAAFSVESLSLFQRIAMPWGIADCLDGLARTAQGAGEFQRSLRFAGLAEATRDAGRVPIRDSHRRIYAQLQAAAASALGEEACAAAWAEGRRMSLEQALAEAREIAGSAAPEGRD